jgi:hypothetical protein
VLRVERADDLDAADAAVSMDNRARTSRIASGSDTPFLVSAASSAFDSHETASTGDARKGTNGPQFVRK